MLSDLIFFRAGASSSSAQGAEELKADLYLFHFLVKSTALVR